MTITMHPIVAVAVVLAFAYWATPQTLRLLNHTARYWRLLTAPRVYRPTPARHTQRPTTGPQRPTTATTTQAPARPTARKPLRPRGTARGQG